MGIQSNVDMSALRNYAEKQKEKFIKAALAAYKMACLDMVNRAKSTNTYIDQTGNLRSSIGYVLYYNGAEVDSYFEPTPALAGVEFMQRTKNSKGETIHRIKQTPGGSGAEGARKGYEYAKQIAEGTGSNGVVAVVVAGMDYALYVETKGYDVLTGSTRQFSGDLRNYLDDVNEQFGTEF